MTDRLTVRVSVAASSLSASLDGFLLDREASRCTPKTLAHYQYTCGAFIDWLVTQQVTDADAITPHHIRTYFVSLQRRGLKDTTQHAHARGIKTFLRWLVDEGELDQSPMARVQMPRLEMRIPPPFAPDEVRSLLEACDRRSIRGSRDYALILTLLDTGLRASEILTLRVGDTDMRSGLCTVMGKGRKMRQIRVGAKARAAITRMLGRRGDVQPGDPLWMAYDWHGGARGGLTLGGLSTLLKRLGQSVGVTPCSPHRFRRTFALWCLRDGMDLHSLRMLMGHNSLAVLQRYLALAGEDVERAHQAHSPADRLLG